MEDKEKYEKLLRVDASTFYQFLNLIRSDIEKQTTDLRVLILPYVKLAATIRFLATVCEYSDLQYIFRVHKSVLSKTIPKVCEGIYSIYY